MQICNDADLGTEYSFPQNQNITGKAPRLLPCSSIASCPDQGSDLITTSQTGEEKEYPDHKWYYMFLRNRELKRYIEIFTGRRAVMINTRSGIKEERYFCFKVFSYTSADHKRRFERCPYSKEEYAARRESAFAVKEAFATGSRNRRNRSRAAANTDAGKCACKSPAIRPAPVRRLFLPPRPSPAGAGSTVRQCQLSAKPSGPCDR